MFNKLILYIPVKTSLFFDKFIFFIENVVFFQDYFFPLQSNQKTCEIKL